MADLVHDSHVSGESEKQVMTEFRFLIDGMLVEGASTLDVINPATGRTLTVAPRADIVNRRTPWHG
jgi:hypothetical protein